MARSFPGSQSTWLNVASVPQIDAITGTALTLSAWCKPTSTSTNNLVSKNNAAGGVANTHFDLFWSGSAMSGRVFDDATSDQVNGSTNLVNLPSWSHVVLRKNGVGANALQLFINGSVDGQVTSNVSITTKTTNFTIGNRLQNQALDPWIGWIAEVAVWAATLTTTEISNLAVGASPMSIQSASLKGYWPICGFQNPEPDFKNGYDAVIAGTITQVAHTPYTPYSPCSVAGVYSVGGWPGRR